MGHSAAGKVKSIEKSSDIGNRTRDLPACNFVPQPTTLPRAPPPPRSYERNIFRAKNISLFVMYLVDKYISITVPDLNCCE
jgi:hypothetical protein